MRRALAGPAGDQEDRTARRALGRARPRRGARSCRARWPVRSSGTIDGRALDDAAAVRCPARRGRARRRRAAEQREARRDAEGLGASRRTRPASTRLRAARRAQPRTARHASASQDPGPRDGNCSGSRCEPGRVLDRLLRGALLLPLFLQGLLRRLLRELLLFVCALHRRNCTRTARRRKSWPSARIRPSRYLR